MEALRDVYRWVKATRKGLLAYCASLPPEVYAAEREDMGWGSIRKAMVHSAACYIFWIGQTVLGRKDQALDYAAYGDALSLTRLYEERVDPLVEELISKFGSEGLTRPLALKVRWQEKPFVVSPLWVFTHVVTHEFHHKGQVVAFGRIHGYPPPETDLASEAP